jgi:hypothetical protein
MKIDFESQTQYGLFRDALYLPDDHTFSDAEIEAMKQQRVDNWVAIMTAPPVEHIFTEDVPVEDVPVEDVPVDLPIQE